MEIKKNNSKIIVEGKNRKFELDKIPQEYRIYVMNEIKRQNKNNNSETPGTEEMKVEKNTKKDCLEFTREVFELEKIKIIDMEYLKCGPLQDLAVDCLLLIEIAQRLVWVGIDFKTTEQYIYRMNCTMETEQLNRNFQPMPGNVYTKSLKNHFVAYVDKYHYFLYDKSYLNKLVLRKAELDPKTKKYEFSDTFSDGTQGNYKTTLNIGPAENNQYFSIMKSAVYIREKLKNRWRYNKLSFNDIDEEEFAKEIENYIYIEVALGRIKTPEEAEKLIMQIVEFKATTIPGIHLLTKFIDNSSQEFLDSIKNRGNLILSRYLILEKLSLVDFKYKDLIQLMLMKETELFIK